MGPFDVSFIAVHKYSQRWHARLEKSSCSEKEGVPTTTPNDVLLSEKDSCAALSRRATAQRSQDEEAQVEGL